MASNHRPGWFDRLLSVERSASRDTIGAEVVELSDVSAGAVEAQKATLSRARIQSVTAQDDVAMTLSAAVSVRAGGDVSMTGSATPLLIAGRDARLSSASAGIVAARTARVDSGTVGVLVAGSAELGNQTRVLLTWREALLLGAAIGIFLPLVVYLLRRFAPPPPQEQPSRPWYARAGLWLLRQAMILGSAGLLGWIAYRALRDRVMRLVPAFLTR